jgi:hypothetical protein
VLFIAVAMQQIAVKLQNGVVKCSDSSDIFTIPTIGNG